MGELKKVGIDVPEENVVTEFTPWIPWSERNVSDVDVTVGDGGCQFHRNHRCPGAHPLERGRFFALAGGRRVTRRPRGARWRPRPGTILPSEIGVIGVPIAAVLDEPAIGLGPCSTALATALREGDEVPGARITG